MTTTELLSEPPVPEVATELLSEPAVPEAMNVADFLRVIKSASRLVKGIAELKSFQENDLGLADWLVLGTLHQGKVTNNKELARNLGVTVRHVNSICQSLARSRLIVVNRSAEIERLRNLELTKAGRTKVEAVNADLQQLLIHSLKGKARSARGAAKSIMHLMSVVRFGRVTKDADARSDASQGTTEAEPQSEKDGRKVSETEATPGA